MWAAARGMTPSGKPMLMTDGGAELVSALQQKRPVTSISALSNWRWLQINYFF
jgi:hypothetical protein